MYWNKLVLLLMVTLTPGLSFAVEYNENGTVITEDMINAKGIFKKNGISNGEKGTRYPSNQAIVQTIIDDPVLKRYTRSNNVRYSSSKNPKLAVWSDKFDYRRDEVVTIFAKLSTIEAEVNSSRITAHLVHLDRTLDKGKKLETIKVFDLSEPNENNLFEINIAPETVTPQPLKAGPYKMGFINDKKELLATITFNLTDPVAEFTGNYRDSITPEGNLKIEAQLNVLTSGRFNFVASLYKTKDNPIASTQLNQVLEKGIHWVPLEFCGLLLHDSKARDTYLLKHIAVTKLGLPPLLMQRLPLHEPDYFINGYQLSDFSDTECK